VGVPEVNMKQTFLLIISLVHQKQERHKLPNAKTYNRRRRRFVDRYPSIKRKQTEEKLELLSSELLRSVYWQFLTDVSVQHIGSIFKGQESQNLQP